MNLITNGKIYNRSLSCSLTLSVWDCLKRQAQCKDSELPSGQLVHFRARDILQWYTGLPKSVTGHSAHSAPQLKLVIKLSYYIHSYKHKQVRKWESAVQVTAVPVHDMKTCDGLAVQLQSFLTSALHGTERQTARQTGLLPVKQSVPESIWTLRTSEYISFRCRQSD